MFTLSTAFTVPDLFTIFSVLELAELSLYTVLTFLVKVFVQATGRKEPMEYFIKYLLSVPFVCH